MTWHVVAAKDVRDAIRSRAAIVATVVLALAFAGLAHAAGALARFQPAGGQLSDGTAETTDLVAAVGGRPGWFLAAVVALVGLVLSNEAIAGERATGSVKILLGLPHARWEVVAGKVAGRSLVVAVAVGVATVAAGAVVAFTYDAADLLPIAGVGAATALLGASYVGVGVGVSAAVASTRRATAAATGFFLVAVFGWDSGVLPRAVLFLTTGELGLGATPDWYPYLAMLSPGSAHDAVVGADPLVAPEPAFAVALLLAWTVVPPALGYLRFRRAALT